jgi:hypothetical protein
MLSSRDEGGMRELLMGEEEREREREAAHERGRRWRVNQRGEARTG